MLIKLKKYAKKQQQQEHVATIQKLHPMATNGKLCVINLAHKIVNVQLEQIIQVDGVMGLREQLEHLQIGGACNLKLSAHHPLPTDQVDAATRTRLITLQMAVVLEAVTMKSVIFQTALVSQVFPAEALQAALVIVSVVQATSAQMANARQ